MFMTLAFHLACVWLKGLVNAFSFEGRAKPLREVNVTVLFDPVASSSLLADDVLAVVVWRLLIYSLFGDCVEEIDGASLFIEMTRPLSLFFILHLLKEVFSADRIGPGFSDFSNAFDVLQVLQVIKTLYLFWFLSFVCVLFLIAGFEFGHRVSIDLVELLLHVGVHY